MQRQVWCMLLMLAAVAGCGKTLSRTATEQLVMSDAVDRSVASIDFRVLSGQRVYLDTTYIKEIKNNTFVNADYIISSLRQQMVAAGCLLQAKLDDAEYVVEARVGALGTDAHELTYGLPANNLLSTAATVVPGAPPIPTIPEISAAKRSDQMGAAKIALFAYERESRQPIWQSGLAIAKSNAKDTWLIGAGPFQSGTIYKGTRFAGQRFRWPFAREPDEAEDGNPMIAYDKESHFARPLPAIAARNEPAADATASNNIPAEPQAAQPVIQQAGGAAETVDAPKPQ